MDMNDMNNVLAQHISMNREVEDAVREWDEVGQRVDLVMDLCAYLKGAGEKYQQKQITSKDYVLDVIAHVKDMARKYEAMEKSFVQGAEDRVAERKLLDRPGGLNVDQ